MGSDVTGDESSRLAGTDDVRTRGCPRRGCRANRSAVRCSSAERSIRQYVQVDQANDSGRKIVFLDPDGTLPDWMFVVVNGNTGVWYQNQYGGTATLQGRVQGFLIPVYSSDARRLLDELFVRDLKGTGIRGGSRKPPSDVTERVRQAVALVRCWDSVADAPEPVPLRLDDERLAEIDEAWVPVLTADGPGMLVWANSD